MSRDVVILQETLPDYRIDFFREVIQLAAVRGITVSVLHGRAPGERGARLSTGVLPDATAVRNRYVRVPGINRAVVWQSAVCRCLKSDLVVVEQANRLVINYFLLASEILRGPKVAFWGHGRNFQARSRTMSERLKERMVVLPSWWFAYTAQVAEHLVSLGVARDRITVVGNTIDVEGLRESISRAGAGSTTPASRCLFMGGLYEDKRLDVLFEAADSIARRVPEFELYIAGEGELRHQVESFVSTRSWAHYWGRVKGEQRARLLASSRLLLVPGLVGLIALDSFAAGVPLVTMAGGRHSPEFEYLENGVNAVVTAGDAPDAYADTIVNLLRDDTTVNRLREEALRAADRHSLRDAAERFVAGLAQALISSDSRIR